MTEFLSLAAQRRELNRRRFLAAGFRGFSAFVGVSLLHGCTGGRHENASGGPPPPPPGPGGSSLISDIANLGPLQPPDGNGIMLPAGFTSRCVARSGQRPASSAYTWHGAPDGGATFAVPGGGWVYVSNSELSSHRGGVGALLFDQNANVVSAYSILTNSSINCAGVCVINS